MPDLSAGFDTPNPFGLMASDFSYDLDGYTVALRFLSDLAGGSDHEEALTSNGGNPGMLIGWQRSEKFRRVYDKCRRAGEAEREALAAKEQAQSEEQQADTGGQRFIPLEEMPVVRSVFNQWPTP